MTDGERGAEMIKWKREKDAELNALTSQVVAMGVYALAYTLASYEEDREAVSE